MLFETGIQFAIHRYEAGRHQAEFVDCRYNQNKGYVVFSAMGSFFIPLTVMLYVYVKIGYVLTSRRQRIVRDAVSSMVSPPHHTANWLHPFPHTPHLVRWNVSWNLSCHTI